jgi:hypothetical protein
MAKSNWRSVSYGCRENPGVWDTGNGAMRYVEENPAYPGVERVTVRSYCGRTCDNARYYRLADDTGQTFESLREAQAALR